MEVTIFRTETGHASTERHCAAAEVFQQKHRTLEQRDSSNARMAQQQRENRPTTGQG